MCMGLAMRHMWSVDSRTAIRSPLSTPYTFFNILLYQIVRCDALPVSSDKYSSRTIAICGNRSMDCLRTVLKTMSETLCRLESTVAFSPALTSVYPSKTFFVRWRLTLLRGCRGSPSVQSNQVGREDTSLIRSAITCVFPFRFIIHSHCPTSDCF
jgi:hypothetical protein